MQRANSPEKTLMVGKIEDGRRRGTTSNEMVGWYTEVMDVCLRKLQEIVKGREAWHPAVHGVAKNWTGLSN